MATEASKESVSKENNHENDFDKKDDNPFIELVNKKIRKANKKMQRIVALKAQIKEKHASINEDQKILLASEEGTTTLLKELEDLRSQMLKLAKESPQPAEAPKKKEKEKKKKETKKEKEAPSKATKAQPAEKHTSPAPVSSQPASSQEQTPATAPEAPKPTQESTPAEAPAPVASQVAPVNPPVQEQKEEPKAESKKEESQASSSKEPEEKSSEKETEDSGEFSSAAEVRAEWKAQKDIYNAKYKHTLGPQQENKYIAVHKGVLYGPCDTLQQLKEAQGGEKLPGAFLARVGHEDEQPVPRRQGRSGYRGGRGRGGGFRNGRGRGGRGRGDQQRT